MAKYGNSGGKNAGKKYKKLTGHEVPTIQNERRARNFMSWYGAHFIELKTTFKSKGWTFNDDVATDTALVIYDAILLKGTRIASYADYFYRAYYTNAMKAQINDISTAKMLQSLDAELDRDKFYKDSRASRSGIPVNFTLKDRLLASDFNYALYEEVVDTLNTEVLEYVRANYCDFDTCIFEIYLGLLPDTSYKRLAALLGISFTKIWQVIGAIKKDVQITFKARKDYLLSLNDDTK
jgi:hypothetical protein